MFFVRSIPVWLLLFALLVGGVSVYISMHTFERNLAERVAEERGALLAYIAETTVSNKAAVSTAQIEQTLSRALIAMPDIRFLQVQNTTTEQAITRTAGDISVLPELATMPQVRDTVVSRTIAQGNQEVMELVYRTSQQPYVFRMGVDRGPTTNAAVMLALLQGLLVIAAIALLGIVLYVIERRFLFGPLSRLEQALSEAAGGPEDERAELPHSIGGLVTSFRGIAEKIRTTLERDKRISEMKSDFISTTAHQLRTPLSGIHWALDSLLSNEKEPLSETQRKMLQRALEKNNELINIVGTLLNAASIEEGESGYHFERGSLKEQIEATMKEEQPEAEEANVTLTFKEGKNAEFSDVKMDAERVRWVLRNLIENAIRYTNEGGTITVSLSQTPKALTVTVADNGIGISEEAKDHIFEKFYRAEEAVKKRNAGSGLGLYIAKKIVNGHGGRIWFESEAGKGTTFSFTIPLPREAQQAAHHLGYEEAE